MCTLMENSRISDAPQSKTSATSHTHTHTHRNTYNHNAADNLNYHLGDAGVFRGECLIL